MLTQLILMKKWNLSPWFLHSQEHKFGWYFFVFFPNSFRSLTCWFLIKTASSTFRIEELTNSLATLTPSMSPPIASVKLVTAWSSILWASHQAFSLLVQTSFCFLLNISLILLHSSALPPALFFLSVSSFSFCLTSSSALCSSNILSSFFLLASFIPYSMFWVKTIQWDPPLCLAYSFICCKSIRVSGRRPICSFVKVFLLSDRDLSTNCCISILKRKNTFYNFLELVVLCFSWSCLYFKHFTPVVINSLIWFFKNFMVAFSLIEPPFIFDLWHFLLINHLRKYLFQIFNLAYSIFFFLLSGWRQAALAKTALSRGNFFLQICYQFLVKL